MSAPLELARLATVHLVPPTPFTSDGSEVSADLLDGFVKAMTTKGVRVFLPAAGTGEFHSLTVDEIEQCVWTTRLAAPDAIVMAPIGFGVAQAIQIARQAAEARADALLVMPPIHPYLSDSGFRDYLQAIADAVPGMPLLAYKKGPIPSDALLAELGATGRLVGIKYAVNDLDAFTLFADAQRGKLGLFCGTAERFASFFMLAGATGYTSGAGNLCPRLTLAMHAALASGRFEEALRLLRVLRPIEDFRAREGDSFNISAVKFGLKSCGWDFGPVRPPQRRLTSPEEAAFRRLLEPILAAEAALGR